MCRALQRGERRDEMPADVLEHGERVLGAERERGCRRAGRRLSGHRTARATGHGKQDKAWPLPREDLQFFSDLSSASRAPDIYVGPRTNEVFPTPGPGACQAIAPPPTVQMPPLPSHPSPPRPKTTHT